MELNTRVSSLEDEMKLLKGEVKLILGEIRAAILSRDNPFSSDTGQGLYADAAAPEGRPPIRVVRAQPEDEEEESPVAAGPAPPDPELPWPYEEGPPADPEAVTSIRRRRESPQPAPEPALKSREEAPPSQAAPYWSLMRVAGLMVWAEEALKRVGPERLQILLDLCEFAGYLPTTAKEALTRVMNLNLAVKERATPPTTNECLVILHQLDALLQEEEPAAILRSGARAGK